MKAIEFETKIKKGIINIPIRYKYLSNRYARIILLTNDLTDKINTKLNMKNLITKIQKREIFRTIKNPSQWQSELRNEWK